jgi:hypothetical protein
MLVLRRALLGAGRLEMRRFVYCLPNVIKKEEICGAWSKHVTAGKNNNTEF